MVTSEARNKPKNTVQYLEWNCHSKWKLTKCHTPLHINQLLHNFQLVSRHVAIRQKDITVGLGQNATNYTYGKSYLILDTHTKSQVVKDEAIQKRVSGITSSKTSINKTKATIIMSTECTSSVSDWKEHWLHSQKVENLQINKQG